jgi:hypothetical protein
MRSVRHRIPATDASLQSRLGIVHLVYSVDSARTVGEVVRAAVRSWRVMTREETPNKSLQATAAALASGD